MQAPTESTSGSLLATAIFVLYPASLAIDLISTIPSSISGTSSSKSSLTISGCACETITCGSLDVSFTFKTKTLILFPGL